MIDDLISREAAIEAAQVPDGERSNREEHYGIIYARVEARRAIQSIPSIPAVPLDKLCEWLENNAALTDGVYISAKEWKRELTFWMEEQNAAD